MGFVSYTVVLFVDSLVKALYPPQEIYLYMSKGPFDSLNIYIHYGLRNLAFKNISDDGPFLTPENFYKRYNI